jgi:hypothetical protein
LGLALVAAGMTTAAQADAYTPGDACGSKVTMVAPAGPSLQNQAVQVSVSGYGMFDTRALELQVFTGTGWMTVASTPMPAQAAANVAYTTYLALPAAYAVGTVQVQAYLQPSMSCAAASSATATYTFSPAIVRYESQGVWASAVTQSGKRVVPTTAKVRFVAYANVATNGTVAVPATTWVLQRAGSNGKWKKVATAEQSSVNGWIKLDATAKALSTSKTAAGGTYKYRFINTTTGQLAATATPTISITYFNVRKVVKSTIAKRCSSTKVVFTNKAYKGASQYVVAFASTKNTISVLENRIKARNDQISKADIEFMAYHECSHILQFRAYSSGKSLKNYTYSAHKKLLAAAKKYFTAGMSSGNAVEHMADCMAAALTKRGAGALPSIGYGGSCSAKQIKLAKKVINLKKI